MDLLNLDALVSVQRQIQIKGESYDLADRSVGDMIEAIQMARSFDEFEKASDPAASAEAVFEGMIRTATQIVPTCPEEVLRGMSMRQLNALLEFANASDQETVEGAEVEETIDVEVEAKKGKRSGK